MLYFSKTILKSLILAAAVIITAFYPPEIYCSNSNEEAKHLIIEDFKKKAANINRKIEQQKAELKTFTIKEKNTLTRLNDADFALNKARKTVSAIRKEIAGIEKKTKETTISYLDLVEKIKTNEAYISKRLVALYKLYWLGKINVLASAEAESMSKIFQRENALERILAHDEDKQEKLIENKAKVKNLLVIMNNKKKEKINLEQALIKQINTISLEKEKRSKLLADIRNKKFLGIAAIESLKNSANELDKTMKAISIEFKQFKQVKKTKDFTSFKGLLNMPVKGKIISFFGPYKNTKFNVKNFRSGIDIKADRGEPIQAVCDGLIIYSSWFKGYGNMIVIAHGRNYYSVYAHIEELFKTKGDKVEKDEVIATVGDTGSMIGSGLYFELRHHGKPVNPLEWLN